MSIIIESATKPDDQQRSRPRLAIRRQDRVVAGLAAGIARVLDIDPVFVRAGFVSLSLAGGFGLLLYAIGWVLTLDEPEPDSEEALRRRLSVEGPRRRLALIMLFLGTLLFLRSVGVWFGDSLVWPATMASFGFALTWSLLDRSRRARWTRRALATGSGRGTVVRIVAGGVLMTAGLGLYLDSIDAVALVGNVVLAVVITVAGLLLVFGPWMWRLVDQLSEERRERIRADERSEMAAHLHDSVLQTLALMQRTDDPRRLAMLARQQERELRTWLYGAEGTADDESLRHALEQVAARVEEIHQVPIDVVTVGDIPLDEPLRAVVGAAGEAITNAARHSRGELISVFAEVNDETVDVYVSDQGVGFDPEAVASDRRGIAESIEGRMHRQGGSARVSSEPGEGTEVHLSMRRS